MVRGSAPVDTAFIVPFIDQYFERTAPLHWRLAHLEPMGWIAKLEASCHRACSTPGPYAMRKLP